MNITTKITREDVDNAWLKFMKYTETLEQHDFVRFAALHLKMEPLYVDLTKNWDDHHAVIFMKGMNLIFGHLGI